MPNHNNQKWGRLFECAQTIFINAFVGEYFFNDYSSREYRKTVVSVYTIYRRRQRLIMKPFNPSKSIYLGPLLGYAHANLFMRTGWIRKATYVIEEVKKTGRKSIDVLLGGSISLHDLTMNYSHRYWI
jgi:hypothetical protein